MTFPHSPRLWSGEGSILMAVISTATLFSLLFLQTNAGPPPQPVDEVVAAVSKNVAEFWNRLPDFVCNEKITSTTYDSGKIRDQKIVESIFTSERKIGSQREITAIDGKPAKKNAKMPGLPVNMSTGFGFVVQATFTPSILQYHDYAFAPQPDADGRLAVQFETKKDQQEIKWDLDGKAIVARDVGTAWIDPASMQVVRIERNFLNLPNRHSRMSLLSEYGPVTIGKNTFWLPKYLRTDLTERDPAKTGIFLAEYSNCRKFGAEVTILP
jgi:hypothetical protein